MATTQEGRELTEAHRVQQVQLGADTEIEAALLTTMYLDGTGAGHAAWLASMLLMLSSRWRQSQRLAAAYLHEFDAAEGAGALATVVELRFPDAGTVDKLTGIVPAGMDIADLDRPMVEELAGMVAGPASQTALAGGRSTIDRTSRRRRVRYRRVSDGGPCAFCAMLAARGPAYSEETAYFRAHPDCGCTAEPVYGSWQPTALEREWTTVYEDAAEQARAAGQPVMAPHGRQRRDTVLWRMRRLRPDLFSDGVHPKAA